jgi:hypothetical protein
MLEITPYEREAFSARVNVPVWLAKIPRPGQVISVKYGAIFRRRVILEKPLDEQLDPDEEAGSQHIRDYFYPPDASLTGNTLTRLGDLRRIGALTAREYQLGRSKCLKNQPAMPDRPKIV